jgi:phosphomevalonate kinase
VRQRGDRVVELVLESSRLSGESTPLGVRWLGEVTQPFHFVARTVDLALRAVSREAPGFTIAFEPSPLVDGHKPGLGSSARAVVLAAEASRWAMGGAFDALKLALLAHAEAQGGKGSGGDVAASFAGGLVRYRRFAVEGLLEASVKGGLGTALAAAPPVDVARLGNPAFPMAYAFSGQSASTTSLVRAIEAEWTVVQRAGFVATSDALGDELELALLRGDFEALRGACAALQRLLFSLGPTKTPALERILAIAGTTGCTGKQSGAGGGDGCLLFAPDEAARAALIEALGARGVFAMPVTVAAGVEGGAAGPLAAWL